MKKSGIVFVFYVLLLVVIVFPVRSNCSICGDTQQTLSVAPLSSMMYSLPSGTNFSIIWITDTQYLSESYPTYYESLCRWIVKNAEKYKVKMVIHTGDIVEDEGNRTYWEIANRSLSQLLDADIPYCWNAGNHDYNETCWIGNEYTAFNPEIMASKPYWIDDAQDGKNTAVQFSVGDWNCLVINLAYEATEDVFEWANDLLDSYPDFHAIVGAHVYLNTTGGYLGKGRDDPDWPFDLKEKVLDTHSNVFLTLSAHHHPAYGSRNEVGGRDELMYNRQDTDSELGAASLRIMSFDLVQGKIYVETYVLYANVFLDDPNNQFTLNTKFYNYELPVAEEPEVPLLTPIILVSSIVVLVVLIFGYKLLRRK